MGEHEDWKYHTTGFDLLYVSSLRWVEKDLSDSQDE